MFLLLFMKLESMHNYASNSIIELLDVLDVYTSYGKAYLYVVESYMH